MFSKYFNIFFFRFPDCFVCVQPSFMSVSPPLVILLNTNCYLGRFFNYFCQLLGCCLYMVSTTVPWSPLFFHFYFFLFSLFFSLFPFFSAPFSNWSPQLFVFTCLLMLSVYNVGIYYLAFSCLQLRLRAPPFWHLLRMLRCLGSLCACAKFCV